MFTKNHKSLVARFVLILALIMGMLELQPIKPVLAATLFYVATSGNDSSSCSTPVSPCLTINGAIGKATNGDTIYVTTGTYNYGGTGNDNDNEVVLLNKNLTLSGGWNNLFTTLEGFSTINGNGIRRGITSNEGTETFIDHFILTNSGNSLLNLGKITVSDVVFADNEGSGFYNSGVGAQANIRNSSFYNNARHGIYNDASMVISNVTIVNNLDVGLENFEHGTVTINNSTITGNQGQVWGSGGISNTGMLYITNSIVTGNINSLASVADCSSITSGFASNGNNIFGVILQPPYVGGCTSITSDKVGIDPKLGFFADNGGPTWTVSLLAGSPAIDAGDDATCATTDQRGVTRPQGSHCDIGAYETIIYYVKSDASGANNGTSWTDAYTDLQTAISAASSGDEIWVAAGTYKPTPTTDRTISFTLKEGVGIYGGFAGTKTLLQQPHPSTNFTNFSGDIGAAGIADNSYHVLLGGGTDNTAILDAFTITAGNANTTYPNDIGGGMVNISSSPSLTKIIFIVKSTNGGGGKFYPQYKPILVNIIITKKIALKYKRRGKGKLKNEPTLFNVILQSESA